jgi:hypothetical protein
MIVRGAILIRRMDHGLFFRQIHTYALSCCMILDSARGFRIHYSASQGHGSVRAYPCVDERMGRVLFRLSVNLLFAQHPLGGFR